MNPYTVLLLYPDYIGQYGEETYLAHVTAPSVPEAQKKAQDSAAKLNDVHPDDSDDFAVLFVTDGFHHDLKELK